MAILNVAVLGLGKVGELVALLLHESAFNVVGIDASQRHGLPFETMEGDVSDEQFLRKTLPKFDAVVSALPFFLNKQVVTIAHQYGVHYFDLTEDVPTAKYIEELAESTTVVLAPQCGLAPGYIAIVGASLAKKFDRLDSIELRVGALPQSPKGLLGYAFNWSAEGVVNEYLNECKVLEEGVVKFVPAMQDVESIIIHGAKLEAFTTSGGLGTMCETYTGKVDRLNYKTMRYPGHMAMMRFFFHELEMRKDRKHAGEILVNAKPPVNDDVVYVHAAVQGWKNENGKEMHCRDEFVEGYYPKEFAGKTWRAISWTTACSIVAIVEMVAEGKLPNKGYIKQEDIALERFLKTKNGGYYVA